jgi:iron complex transport system ATP-binding protein
MLEIENLSVGYNRRAVLEGVNLTVAPGEVLVLAGPNGGGKTTFLKAVGGYEKPLAGRVLLNGQDVQGMKKRERAEMVGFVFQGQGAVWPFSVEETIAQGRFPYRGVFGAEKPNDQSAVEKAIQAAGLDALRHRSVTELSGGEYQRVLIARAMAQEARVMILDEPVNNLDPKYQFMVMDLIRSMAASNMAVLVSLHDLNLAGLYGDRIAFVHRGRIAALGTPAEVLRKDILSSVYDITDAYIDKLGGMGASAAPP